MTHTTTTLGGERGGLHPLLESGVIAVARLPAAAGLRAACEVIDAGARFVVSPTLTPAVIRVCRDRDIPCMPGAFTPTEIVEAWRAGAPLVKLFPAAPVGPGYLRDLLAPLPFLRLVPSGGVSLENVGDWIRAGAAAVSVGSALLPAALVRSEAAGGAGGAGGAELTLRARAFVERVAQARAQLAGGAA